MDDARYGEEPSFSMANYKLDQYNPEKENLNQWIQNPQQAHFVKRVNRFACQIELEGELTKDYLPNSGRREELLILGAVVIIEKRRESGKTLHDLLLMQSRRYPVSLMHPPRGD